MPRTKPFEERIEIAEKHIDNGNYEKAIYQYEKCIENFPEKSKEAKLEDQIVMLKDKEDNDNINAQKETTVTKPKKSKSAYLTTENPKGVSIKGTLLLPTEKLEVNPEIAKLYETIKDVKVNWS